MLESGEPKSRSPRIENFDVDHSHTAERARDVVKKANEMFSVQRYSETGKRLNIHWRPRFSFNAFAGINPTHPDEHLMAFTEGAPRALHSDAFALSRLCERHFVHPHYDILFGAEIFDYGQGRENVLPRGLNAAEVADRMFRLSMAWLYLHEQGHLFQQHSLLPGNAPDTRLIYLNGISSIGETQSPTAAARLTGQDAIRSHVLELAADAEATSLIGQLLIVVDGGTLSKGSLWSFVCGLMCMFQLFYGKRELRAPEALGSHPDPAFRLRVALRQFARFLLHSKVQPHVPWANGLEDIQRLFDHATVTASAYWTIRIQDIGRPAVPNFFAGLHSAEAAPAEYSEALFQTWCELEPAISAQYIGWGDGPSFDPVSADFLS